MTIIVGCVEMSGGLVIGVWWVKFIRTMPFFTKNTLGARVPGFEWEHAEYIAGIETLCPAFALQEHPVHIWNVIWVCAPNVPIGNISFTAGMRPCHVSTMYPPGTFQMLSTHVHKIFPAYAQWACCGYMHFI
jgi:hypothetical protein